MKRRVTKQEWYDAGGFANSNCFRKADKRGVWQYFILED
jgi:hypothetical protein